MNGQVSEGVAGSIKLLEGHAAVVRAGIAKPGAPGMLLLSKDVLRTEGDGRVGVLLRDGTRLSLGPSSELSIEKFLYEPAQQKFGLVIRIIRGAAAYVSGKIAQFAPDSVQAETPTGMIGLRGTKFAVSVEGAQ